MTVYPDDNPSADDASNSEQFRHKLRNEAHAIWLGTRLLMEHLKKDNTPEAIVVGEALIEAAANLRKLVEAQ